MSDISYGDMYSMSDLAITNAIGQFVKHHRLLQNKTQDEVALAANISRSTLSLLERGQPITLATLIQVLRVLELLQLFEGFKIMPTVSPIQLAKEDQQKMKRARKKNKGNEPYKSSW
ncbi:helix-turn-helix domain-containing protein [Salibacteraceae bacterium]|nr:transcriptional regulator [Crocinitomicaceae bacterium]MDA7730539.1 helix-turn-helix domain-containing protein [Salibacteraceae bacterium]MDB0058267.1 helix-turn-helix domain-containing protein [Salibacteraceae bacterium]|tara:strand:- start:40917 stop:41267 length:351 start_codon:yes stop_codon:yes gene_type:complete